MNFFRWAVKELGFSKSSRYQKQYINETNIRTGIYMSFMVVVLELWMILRYIHQRPGRTPLEYFDGETNYLILFSAGLILLTFAWRYGAGKKNFTAGKIISAAVIALDAVMIARYVILHGAEMTTGQLFFGMKYHLLLIALAFSYLIYELIIGKKEFRTDIYGQMLNIIFAVICLGFGIETSLYDISRERQILCFITMVSFVACMLIWKPYVSLILLGATFLYFYYLWLPHLEAIDAAGGKVKDGDSINFFILWIVLAMISISIYHQRRLESEKDEGLINANKTLNRVIQEDDLTGIHNMFYFNQEAVEVLNDPSVDFSRKIFLFLNIENFKTYNDQFGYQAGNEYLQKLAEVIRDTFTGDPVARQADDHFAVLTDVSGVEEKTERVRDVVRSNDSEIYLELKVGGFRPPSRDVDPRMAVDSARYACSRIKNKYNLNYKEYDEEVDSRFHKNQYIVNHVDSAVKNGHIKVFYQPVVWSDTREMCGLEALARWDDPKYGFLSPGVFIPVLEEYRQIHKLDACIFEQVCRDMREAMDKGKKVVPVSLNFSRLDFELMDAVSVLEGYVEKYRIPKDYLHVEVTESALNENTGLLEKSMDRFHADGYSIWLDDFGSGYSSLNVLKDFSFDVLKIDMKFLTNFEKNGKSRIILDTIISLADGIGMKSLTEGVETEEAAEFLRKEGCGRLQGYLFGKPMPLEELSEKIADGTYTVSSKLE
ncbi:MAG: EAL domain-containing protein [Lachnospiraceae bacterium]|nr:EAL domain-containing protein [Lachnospiraceae bacterium]